MFISNHNSFNGERVRLARLYRGMTTSELADKMGLKRQTISSYENNKTSKPDFSNLLKLSQCLNFPIDFFMENNCNTNVEVCQSTYFRALLTTNKKYRQEQNIKINFLATIFSYISEYIEFPTVNIPSFREYNSPEDAANALRKFWNLGDSPIKDIIYLVESNGIIVSSYETNTNDIDAFSKKFYAYNNERFVVAYSKNKGTACRIHFDIAHELGHIMLHNLEEDIEILPHDEFKQIEQEANDFASAFLLPKEAFIKDIGDYAGNLNYYIQLKKKWKVSISAMIRRAKNLDLINYDMYQRLMRKMQNLGIKKIEPLDDILVTSQPELLKASVEMLLENDVLTPDNFIEELKDNYYLSINPTEIEILLGLKKGTLDLEKSSKIIKMNLKLKDNSND